MFSFKNQLGFLALAANAAAQFASYTSNNYGVAVHIPADTASSKSGSIYFQITAPSGTQWVAAGQGEQMAGANIFVVYAANSQTLTLSPRTGLGEFMPMYNQSIQAKLLDGSGIMSDGSIVANVQCDTCLNWSGGSMDPTSSSANWLMSYKTGNALNSNSPSATIVQHDEHFQYTLDLTKATGGPDNPFAAAAASGSPSSSGSATTSPTGAVSTPVTSSMPNSGSSGSSSSSSTHSGNGLKQSPLAHGVIMSILFVGLFPIASMTLFLPTNKRVRYIHMPLQLLNLALLIIGMSFGIVYGKQIHMLNMPHQIIGYVVVATIIVFQPALGTFQHLYYHKHGGRSPAGPAHQWLGRVILLLGLANGGYGWSLLSTKKAYPAYAVLAAVVYLTWIGLALFNTLKSPKSGSSNTHEKNKPSTSDDEQLTSQTGPVDETKH